MTEFRALLWGSPTTWAVELDALGTIVDANPALEEWAQRPLTGEPLSELLAAPQREAFLERLTADAARIGEPILLSFHEGGAVAAEDRWLRIALLDGTLYAVAEPAGAEHARLVSEVLELNDDLISAQRSLSRRQRELERAQAEARDAMRQVRRLESITLAGLTLEDLGGVLRALLHTAKDVLDGDGAAVALAEEDGTHLTCHAAVGIEQEAGRPRRVEVGEGPLGALAAQGGGAVALPDDDLGGSLAAVPLTLDGQVIGVLHVSSAEPDRYEAADLRLLERVGERAALAIGHAQLRDRERRIAEILQRSLLPDTLPRIPGVALAARYLPSSTAANVGGDFYDALTLPDGRVALVIGDVAGKGLRAASSTGHVRSSLRAYVALGLEPAEVMDRIDGLVAESAGMVTAIYAVLDPAAGTIRWSNAGHPPPLLVPADGPARYLTDGLSAPLGVDLPGRTEAEAALPDGGASLLLYTDGLVERRTATLDAGLERLRLAAQSAPAGPDALCESLVARLEGAGYQDDVALLAAGRA